MQDLQAIRKARALVKKLILHLGDCKTGTTSIQEVLSQRNWASEGSSILYPHRFNAISLAKSLHQKGLHQDRMVDKLVSQLLKSDSETAIISAEHFEFLPPDKLYEFIHGPLARWKDNVRVVSYVRPHAERFASTFAERSKKGGCTVGLNDFYGSIVEKNLLHYSPRFAENRRLFGERFTLRPFIRSQLKNGDVVADFFNIALEGASVTFPNRADQNESLSLEDLVLFRMFHSHFHALGSNAGNKENINKAYKAFGWSFAPIFASHPSAQKTKLKLHRELAVEIAAAYAKDAAALDEMFFDTPLMSERLAAAPAEAIDTPQSLKPQDYHSPEVLRLVQASAEFYSRMILADPQHFTWATRPEHLRNAQPPNSTKIYAQRVHSKFTTLKNRFLTLTGKNA